jgi:hypothetical protein
MRGGDIYFCNYKNKSFRRFREYPEPNSNKYTGKQDRKRLIKTYASRCEGFYHDNGCWYRTQHDTTVVKIYMTGFPSEAYMNWVIQYADTTWGKDYVIPSKELDRVFEVAKQATSLKF